MQQSKEIKVYEREPTEKELQRILDDAADVFSEGLAFGDHMLVRQSAALHNVKTFEAYKVMGFSSWKAYCESIGLNRENSYKYLGVARRQIAEIPGVDPEGKFMFTKQHLAAILNDTLKRYKTLSLSDAVRRADRFETSLLAMTGDELLKQRPALPAPSDSEIMSAKAKQSELADFNDHMRKVCEAHGWKWNAKEKRCEHEDGSPITPEEQASITPPSAALHVWQSVEREVLAAMGRIKETIVRDAKTYSLYAKHIPNPAMERAVTEIRDAIRERYEETMQMLDALVDGDEQAVKRIHKHGLEN